ncbi:MAG: hypothetical protein ACM3PU_18270 [Gemmatimonadota bacterium]
MKALLAALVVLLAAGCATVDPYAGEPMRDHLARRDEVGDCARLFRDTDATIDRAGTRDALAPRVPGFPYLRVDRFVESLGDRAVALPNGFAPWSELMARLDRDARAVELGNAADAKLPQPAALDACRDLLAVTDRGRLADLRAAAHVPDDYSLAMRALGLYPLTRLVFAAGIRRWHDETRATFAAPAAERLPSIRYAPAAVVSLPQVPRSAAFQLPLRSRAEWAELLQRNAPRLVVDTATDDDRLGSLVWRDTRGAMRVGVDTRAPVAYARVVFARLADRIVPQLVYTFWFPARPPAGSFDLLAGALDGIVWRVTLDDEFRPLVYDSIHPCGCYHLFFPTERVRARPQPASVDESMFAPQTIVAPRDGEHVVLHVASRTHYLSGIDVEPDRVAAAATRYPIRDENELRRLPLPAGGTRSVYGPDGLIAGSERPERFLFWPMGIESAGQMRQWGHHATAFVGRRHFDDPLLIDRYFERAPDGASDAPGAGVPVADLELGER